jgi:hypothetical protein
MKSHSERHARARRGARGRFAALAALMVLATCASCGSSEVDAPLTVNRSVAVADTDAKVVILVIDGPRYTESFGDPTHAHIPRMWNEVRPQGTLFTNFRNEGWTSTVPGHSSIITGTWQYLDNTGAEHPTKPTLFEYYRYARAAAQSEGYVISGKSKLGVCSYSTDPGYGAAYGATAVVGLASDLDVYNTLISTLQNDRPHVVMACFPQVDLSGHSGVWSNYLAAIEGADSLVANAWSYIQSDSFYAGHTYVFVTADHGRHDDAHGGFSSHGDGCEGCRHIFCLALGPDIRQDYTVSNIFVQRDIGVTAAAVLGIPAPQAEGYYMQDMFEPVNTGVLE